MKKTIDGERHVDKPFPVFRSGGGHRLGRFAVAPPHNLNEKHSGEIEVKFAVTSQDYLTITAHAGKTTRFLLFEADPAGEPVETGRLDLDDEQTIHNFRGGRHPLDGVHVLIARSAGQCFVDRMKERGIVTVVAPDLMPREAVAAYLSGHLKPASQADACECHD